MQFTKRDWRNRNFIITENGPGWLTIPVQVKGKFHQKKWGRLRLHNGLKEKQISAYNCKLALAQISEKEYLNTFNTLAQTRWQALEKETSKPKKKQKFISYLQYRGWESHLIWEALVALEKV